jgi:uncharacterized membrane protein (DUF4010 family)
VALVSVLSSALEASLGKAGMVMVAGVAALVDAHSTTGSVATMHAGALIDTQTARLAILTALSTNTLTKIVMAFTGRAIPYALCVSAGVVAIAGLAWLGLVMG